MIGFNNLKDLNEKELLKYPESALRLWFIDNFGKLGYEQIIGGSQEGWKRSIPDFVVLKNNQKIRVELETVSSHFILHHHMPQQVDEVVCFVKDKNLPVKVVEVKDMVNKEILDQYSKKVIYQQKCDELLLYDNNWMLIKDLINASYVYEYLEELSQSNPKKFLEIYEEFCKRKRERSRKDYESHTPFALKQPQKPKFCVKCGKEFPLDANFCPHCGNKPQIQ